MSVTLDDVHRLLERTSVVGEHLETPDERRWLDALADRASRQPDRLDWMICRAFAACRSAGLEGMTEAEGDNLVAILEKRIELAQLIEAGAVLEKLREDGAFVYEAVLPPGSGTEPEARP